MEQSCEIDKIQNNFEQHDLKMDESIIVSSAIGNFGSFEISEEKYRHIGLRRSYVRQLISDVIL